MMNLYVIMKPDGTGMMVCCSPDRIDVVLDVPDLKGSTTYLIGHSHPSTPPAMLAQLSSASSMLTNNAMKIRSD